MHELTTYLISRGKGFQTERPAKEKERCPNIWVVTYGKRRVLESEYEWSCFAGEYCNIYTRESETSSKQIKGSKERYLLGQNMTCIRTKHSMRILGIIGLLCFILINSVILNLLCVWIYVHQEDQTDKHEEKSESEKSDSC